MLKKTLIVLLFVIAVYSLSAQQLMHFYYKDYKEITRLVFVLDNSVFFKVNMDTDNRFIEVELSNCKRLASMLPPNINLDNQLIEKISIMPNGRDLNIRINTKRTFYGEMFTVKNETFKLVFDIYTQEEPSCLESAQTYLDFYEKVSLFNRANALKKRIKKNEFKPGLTQQAYFSNEEADKPVPQKEPEPLIPKITQSNDLFKLMTPPMSTSHPNYQWVKDSFEILKELRKIMVEDYEQARLTLNQYREANKVDVTFLEKLSTEHNLIARHPLTLNSVKIRAEKQLSSTPKEKNAEVRYTINMLNTLSASLPEFQKNMQNLIDEYQKTLNQ